jgi:hypothetical protein
MIELAFFSGMTNLQIAIKLDFRLRQWRMVSDMQCCNFSVSSKPVNVQRELTTLTSLLNL